MDVRLLVSLLICAVSLAAQVSPPAPGSEASAAPAEAKAVLEGHVYSAATGEVLRKATLRLRMAATGAMTTSQIVDYATTSEKDGSFLFDDVGPGHYSLWAERAGFVMTAYGARSASTGGTQLTISSGQHLTNLDLKMTPAAVISGRVVDEDGDPMRALQVTLFRYAFRDGSRQLVPAGGSGLNPEGAFILADLGAGRYYVAAQENRPMMTGERPGRKGPEEGYALTYFPNAQDFSSATPIDLSPGSDARGIEIRMRKTPVFHIRGKLVTTVPGASMRNLYLVLYRRDGPDAMYGGPRTNAMVNERDGTFEFSHVLPGMYTIQGTNRAANGVPLAVYQPIAVSEQSLDDLQIPLTAGLELSGKVKTDGVSDSSQPQNAAPSNGRSNGTASSPPPQIQVFLSTQTPGLNQLMANVDDNGVFQIRGIGPEKYRVLVRGTPDGSYVKQIEFGGQDVTKTPLDLTQSGGGALEILLSPSAADVSGVVRTASGDAVPGVMVTIWEPGSPAAGETKFFRSANTDQNGGFKLRNIAPGDYRVAAWEDVEFGLVQDPDFRKHFEGQASTVTLHESSHESVEVKMIPKDAIEAEAAKVR